MSLFGWARDALRPIPTPDAPATRAADRPTMAGVARGAVEGGRLSVDTEQSFWGVPKVVIPPISADTEWRALSLDDETLRRMPPTRLLELLADLSPDVSRALWDFLRLCNPGWTCEAMTPDGKSPAPVAQAATDAFLTLLDDYYGSCDVVWGRLFTSAFLRGALMAELVLDDTGHLPVDFATPDPASARYQRYEDPVRGIVWQLGQWQNRAGSQAGFVPLDRPTIRYVPIDPFPGSPYGRAMAAPALFSTLFLLGLMHDLRRVVSQQGYPRLDLSVSMEAITQSMPPSEQADPVRFQAWVNGTIAEVIGQYKLLQPDDAFVHTDVVTVNRPVGTVDASSLGAIDGLIQSLERMSVRALKSVPFMMSLLQGSTETQATREWAQMLASIRSVQHYAETLLCRLLCVALQVQGIPGMVCFRFAESRASERMMDAQTDAMEIANAAARYSWGWISQDAAAKAGAGMDTADATAPRILPRGATETTDADAPQVAPETAGGTAARTMPLRVVGDG